MKRLANCKIRHTIYNPKELKPIRCYSHKVSTDVLLEHKEDPENDSGLRKDIISRFLSNGNKDALRNRNFQLFKKLGVEKNFETKSFKLNTKIRTDQRGDLSFSDLKRANGQFTLETASPSEVKRAFDICLFNIISDLQSSKSRDDRLYGIDIDKAKRRDRNSLDFKMICDKKDVLQPYQLQSRIFQLMKNTNVIDEKREIVEFQNDLNSLLGDILRYDIDALQESRKIEFVKVLTWIITSPETLKSLKTSTINLMVVTICDLKFKLESQGRGDIVPPSRVKRSQTKNMAGVSNRLIADFLKRKNEILDDEKDITDEDTSLAPVDTEFKQPDQLYKRVFQLYLHLINLKFKGSNEYLLRSLREYNNYLYQFHRGSDFNPDISSIYYHLGKTFGDVDDMKFKERLSVSSALHTLNLNVDYLNVLFNHELNNVANLVKCEDEDDYESIESIYQEKLEKIRCLLGYYNSNIDNTINGTTWQILYSKSPIISDELLAAMDSYGIDKAPIYLEYLAHLDSQGGISMESLEHSFQLFTEKVFPLDSNVSERVLKSILFKSSRNEEEERVKFGKIFEILHDRTKVAKPNLEMLIMFLYYFNIRGEFHNAIAMINYFKRQRWIDGKVIKDNSESNVKSIVEFYSVLLKFLENTSVSKEWGYLTTYLYQKSLVIKESNTKIKGKRNTTFVTLKRLSNEQLPDLLFIDDAKFESPVTGKFEEDNELVEGDSGVGEKVVMNIKARAIVGELMWFDLSKKLTYSQLRFIEDNVFKVFEWSEDMMKTGIGGFFQIPVLRLEDVKSINLGNARFIDAALQFRDVGLSSEGLDRLKVELTNFNKG